jgi:hypothetical protein
MGLWDNINQFIANGQDRRAWLDDKVSGVVDYYTPPHLRQATRFAAEMNPIQGMSDSMSQFGVAANPSVSMDERRRAAVNSLTEGLLAVAPAALAARGVMTPVRATLEGLLGWSPAAQQIGDDVGRFVADEAGHIGWNKLPMYHGTPDVREIADAGGFSPRTKTVRRLSDPNEWDEVQGLLGDITPGTSAYFKKLDEAGSLVDDASIRSPVFFSPDYRMAGSYADDTRAFDYQNAVPEVVRADTSPQNILDVNAGGNTFTGINRDVVRKALEGAGIDPEDADAQIRRYMFGRTSDKISTDDLAAIADGFGFDAVDVSNVKDDYYGGGAAGRVRMMLNPDQINVPKYAPTLPAPRNEAETMARGILDLRAAGRASEVTDDMMAKADPQYMFNNTPLPMDEASRMARAEEMGFGMSEELYHGTGSDILSVDPRMARMDSEGAGFYTTDDPYTASGYAEIDGVSRGKVYPLAARSDVPHVYADFEGRVWNEFSPEIDPSRFGSTLHHDYDPFGWGDVDPNDLAFDRYSTDDIARSAKIDGHEAAIFENVFDGVGVDAPDYSSTIRADFNPVNIRSRFARFDPEFRHLANLSAGIGGLGLLGYVGNQSSDPLQTPRAE